MDARKILTEDCWTEVFKRVESALDLKACSETCTLFETILDRTKSSWMLGVIIPFIFNYLNLHRQEDDEVRRRQRQTVLRTRQVSKTLCHAVDTYLETPYDRRYFPLGLNRLRTPYLFCQENERNMDEFLRKFENHRGNPFIGRNVYLFHFTRQYDYTSNPRAPYNEDECRQESLYLGKVVQILNEFGHNVWTFKFYELEHYQSLRFCKALRLLLSHLPNLRNLDCHQFSPHRIDEREWLDKSDREEGMDKLVPYLTVHPLPALPLLETLDVKGLSIQMGHPLVEQYAPHLKFLRMYDHRPFSRCADRFNCLKELDLWVDAGNSLEGLRVLQSPLEILSVEVRWDKTNQGLYDIQQLLLNLRHLPLLKDLKIASELPIAESVPISPDLQIESIRRVQIIPVSFMELALQYVRTRVSFNFLLCLTNLEEVKLFIGGATDITAPHPRGIPEQLSVLGLLLAHDLYASDIWERIPSLKQFSFNYGSGRLQRTSWNRGGYMEWKRRRPVNNKKP